MSDLSLMFNYKYMSNLSPIFNPLWKYNSDLSPMFMSHLSLIFILNDIFNSKYMYNLSHISDLMNEISQRLE